jgi:SMI1 / KNR4 family (SUKH-1)
MIDRENNLIERLIVATRTGLLDKQQANPPVRQEDLVHAEAMIGFSFPPILRRIYLEVGNGGFGPGYGLLPLNNKEDPDALMSDSLVTDYVAMHSSTQEQMEAYRRGDVHTPPLLPEKMLMICDWGCNIASWLDCTQLELPVLKSEATLDWEKFEEEAPSFLEWMEVWLHNIQSKREER